ncbi:MAG: ribonuclease HIII [Ignavibacteria bacterium]|jgi:ribonuclease HIII
MDTKHKAYATLSDIRKKIISENIIVQPINELQYNYETIVSNTKSKLKIQVYFGKNGVKIVLQGNKADTFYDEIYALIFGQQQLNLTDKPLDEPNEYVGTDESGKGDFFGPLVVGGVFVNKKTFSELNKINIRDSKTIDDNTIGFLSKKIVSIVKDYYDVILITPEKYNQLYNKFNNLNSLLDWCHSKVIENILHKIDCKTVITDKFSNKRLTIQSKTEFLNTNFIQTPKAEKYTAVAAASILARNSFNEWFIKHSSRKYRLLKGASEDVSRLAKSIYNNYGEEELKKIAKLHFKTYKNIKKS